jgi:capsular exopolysaccharide synthesis family protein
VDLQTYLRILHKRWRVIPIVTLLVVALAAGITYTMPKAYESQLQFFVSTVDTSNNSQLAQGSNFLQQRVKSYSQLISAPVVLEPVVKRLGLEITPDQLGANVSANIPTDTVLIDVTVTYASPRRAQAIAEAISEEFPKTVADLEKVSTNGSSPVKVTVTRSPTFNSHAVSPKPIRNLALGLVLGLCLAVAVALLRHALDTRVRSKDDIERVTDDVAVIGSIPFDGDASRNPILVESGTVSTRSEAFRALRTNLAFVGTAARARTIVMTSSLPGEGKTTTAANLGVVLADSGASVCLIEADLRRPRLLEYFGMEGAVGLTDLLIGRADIQDVLQPYGRHQLTLLGGGQIPPNPSELLGSPAMRELLQELAGKFDYVLLDGPPMLPVTDSAVLSTLADGAVVVVGSGLVTRDQLASAIEGLETVEARILGITLNRVPRNASGGRYYDYDYEYRPRRERANSPKIVHWEDSVSNVSPVEAGTVTPTEASRAT